MKILLDAGHGGRDPGAVNEDGLREKDITLEVVIESGTMLQDAGHSVLYTRDRDIGLTPSQRLEMIKEYKPEVFVSVHCNASTNTEAHGIETIWKDKYDKPLAEAVHKSLLDATGLKDRGLKQDGGAEYKRGLAVLKDLETPACLIEIGFISNENDLEVIKDTDLIAEAIAEGVKEYADNN